MGADSWATRGMGVGGKGPVSAASCRPEGPCRTGGGGGAAAAAAAAGRRRGVSGGRGGGVCGGRGGVGRGDGGASGTAGDDEIRIL